MFKAYLAGITIGLGSLAYMACYGLGLGFNILGSFLFSFGLLAICYEQLNLVTGKFGAAYTGQYSIFQILGMFIMNIEVVNIRSLGYLKKREQVLRFIYSLFQVFLISFFVPMTSIPFVEMFRIQLLFIILLFSLAFMLINMTAILFDQYNRSLFDRLLGVIHLKTADLDEVYRAKGYYL